MGWKQVKAFDLKKMGTEKGYCLQNVRVAFGIPSKYNDAKAAMEANKKAGTLHPISELPKDIAVPVFADTASVHEHVLVYDHGTYYSDGKRLTNPSALKYFGWGETLNDVRIVEKVKDPEPAPAPAPAPEPTPAPKPSTAIKAGDTVVPTRLVSYDGVRLRQYDKTYTVTQIRGDRAVLSARGAVWAAMNVKDLRKA